jgi:glucosamine--fructose-6-phosphate aminotransferase (isomerizing)
MIFEEEVREQPDTVGRLLRTGRRAAEEIAAGIEKSAPRFVLIAARGSSDNAARYGQYLLGIENGLVVGLSAPSIITHYDAKPDLRAALVIGISQSGQSPDVVAVIGEARRQGGLTVALTNEPQSPLARASAHLLPLEAGAERAVAATKTYTAQLVGLAMISAALKGSPAAWAELESLPEQIQEALGLWDRAGLDIAPLKDHRRLVVVGRGYNLATVFELALKIKETSYVMADPYSSADFLHGPAALLDRSLPVVAVAPTSRKFDDLAATLQLARERGSPVVVLSDQVALRTAADLFVPLPAGVPEWLSPVVTIVSGQMLAQALARVHGLTPDAPRGLSKVTLTR